MTELVYYLLLIIAIQGVVLLSFTRELALLKKDFMYLSITTGKGGKDGISRSSKSISSTGHSSKG